MNKPQPIETANNSDLRGSWLALQRAAVQARQTAAQTGTALVVIRDGVLEHIYPQSPHASPKLEQPSAGYRESK